MKGGGSVEVVVERSPDAIGVRSGIGARGSVGCSMKPIEQVGGGPDVVVEAVAVLEAGRWA